MRSQYLSAASKFTWCVVAIKAYTTTIASPSNTWQLLASRCNRDKAFVRWPPHVNLLYPFHDDSGKTFSEAAQRARDSLAALQPFQVCSAGSTIGRAG